MKKIKFFNRKSDNINRMTNGLKMNIWAILIMISIVPLIISTVILSIYSINALKKNVTNNYNETLFVVASNLASHCENEQISYSTADRFNDYIDSLTDHDIDMAILIKGAPSVASIKNDNDYRIRDIVVRDEVYANPDLPEKGVYIDDFIINEKSYLCYFRELNVNGERLGVVMSAIPSAVIDSQTTKVFTANIILSIILVVVLSVFVLWVTKDVTKSFAVIKSNINSLAEGNLKNTKLKDSRISEISSIVAASNSTANKLEDIIGNVLQASDNLANDVSDVTSLSENNADKASSITMAMHELAESTNQMADYVSGISVQMSDMGDSITNISESVEQLNSKSGTLMSANDEAKKNIDGILESNRQAFVAVGDIASQIKETNGSIANINAAVDIILDIANKTKLLSLNASIEAARAGEAGRGFAVVADEIRQLSEQSSTGAESIRKVAQLIVEESAKSVELADEVYRLMNNEKDNVALAGKSYEELAQNIRESAEEIESIAKKTESLTEAKQNVLTHVEQLSALSEQNAAGNQEVTSNVEEISSDAHKIYNNCDAMNQLADALKESIAFFNI